MTGQTTDALADLSNRWAHLSEGTFPHIAAHFVTFGNHWVDFVNIKLTAQLFKT